MHDSSLITRLVLAGGAIGAVLFILVFFVEGAIRPGYNAWHQMVSDLSLGQRGWVQITNFLVCGLLMLGFAVGLRQALPSSRALDLGCFHALPTNRRQTYVQELARMLRPGGLFLLWAYSGGHRERHPLA
ncbi:MAG: DUF998 domain-containing protein [Ktedonobacterales bacterium]